MYVYLSVNGFRLHSCFGDVGRKDTTAAVWEGISLNDKTKKGEGLVETRSDREGLLLFENSETGKKLSIRLIGLFVSYC